ncbi:MAG: hypothetical protein HY760_06090 [Nitrospirae bacterium]|nr:hypothetical protein [Nitrospirota bacterium]
MNQNVIKIADLSREAGRIIMEIYGRKEIEVTLKDDRTPLTAADRWRSTAGRRSRSP